jgi:hypothetical protein
VAIIREARIGVGMESKESAPIVGDRLEEGSFECARRMGHRKAQNIGAVLLDDRPGDDG